MNRDVMLKIAAELQGETRQLHWFRDHEPTEDDYCYECIQPLAFRAAVEIGPVYEDDFEHVDPEDVLEEWIDDWLAGGPAPWAGPRDDVSWSALRKIRDRTSERIDGGWDAHEADGPRICELCGVRLQFSPTDYCFEEEARHYTGPVWRSKDFGRSGSEGIQFSDLADVGHLMEYGDWGAPQWWGPGRKAYEAALDDALTPDVCRASILGAAGTSIPRTPLARAVERWAAMNPTRTHRLRRHLEVMS